MQTFEARGGKLHANIALALKVEGPGPHSTCTGMQGWNPAGWTQIPISCLAAEKGSPSLAGGITHTPDPSTSTKALLHQAHTCPGPATSLSWQAALALGYLRPSPQVCLPPNFQAILTCSPAPVLSQGFHAPTICGFLTTSHLSPPNPADTSVPISLARTPGSLPAPWGHQQEGKCEIGTRFVFPNRQLERWEQPLRSHPRHSDSRTRAGLYSCTCSWERSRRKQVGWYHPCVMGYRWSPQGFGKSQVSPGFVPSAPPISTA